MLGKLGKYGDTFGEYVEMNELIIVDGVLNPSNKMKFATKCFQKLDGEDIVEVTQMNDETKEF